MSATATSHTNAQNDCEKAPLNAQNGGQSGRLYAPLDAQNGGANGRLCASLDAQNGGANGRLCAPLDAQNGGANGRLCAPKQKPTARWLGPLILFAIVIGMYWKLVLTRQYTWLNTPDGAGLVLPWFELQAASLHRWALALWDPYQWCGQPLAAQGQAGTLYPLNWLLWALPLHRTWLRHVYLNWYFVLIHFQAALFAYWLCRDAGRTMAASLVGGIVFAFGPFVGTNEWPVALNAAAWAPLQLLFFFRAVRGEQPFFSAAACGAALGASWLSGSDQIPILLSLVMVAVWIWHAVRIRSWRLPLIAAAMAIGIGAMQILPGIEYLAYEPRIWFASAARLWQTKAVSPLALPSLVAPGAGDWGLFIGWAPLAFAAIGIWRSVARIEMRVCAWLGAAGLVLAAGPYAMFGGALYGSGWIAKDPHSALCLLALAAALPAATGVDAVRQGAGVRPVRRIVIGAAVLCGLCLFFLSMIAGSDFDRLTPIALCGLAALITFGLLESRARGAISGRAVAVSAILLVMWDFGHVAGMEWRNIEFGWPHLERLAESSDLATFMRSQGKPVRVANPDHTMAFDLGDWNGIEQFDGVTGGTQNVTGLADLPAVRALAGVGFMVAANAPGEPVFQSASGLKLYALPDVFPRAWVVNHVTGAASEADITKQLRAPASELRSNAFVTGDAPRLDSCANPGVVSAVSGKGRHVTLRAALTCPALVTISQTWYPGWDAYVDGKPGRLYESYGFLDGVVVPAGDHSIELIYRPWSIWLGAAITGMSVIVLMVSARRRLQTGI